MSYNAVTIPLSLAMSSPDAPGLTPESNARDIASLTQALDMVVSQFVRPSVQQANANRETLNEVIDLLSRHAQGLLSQEQRVDQLTGSLESVRDIVAQNAQQIAATTQQQQTNAQQIAQNTEAITAITQRLEQFDTRLEETRQLVAKNSSNIAQLSVKQDRNAEQIEKLTVKQDRNAELIAELRTAQRENATQVEALAEASRTQLAGIIGNGRRIDRLEQQAS